MSRGMSDGEKLLIGGAVVGLGALGLYYLTAGLGREKNAILIPDFIEDRIDLVVDTLNQKVGKDWVNWGADALKSKLRRMLPSPLVMLVDAVYAVEQQATRTRMSKQAKRRDATDAAVAWGLA